MTCLFLTANSFTTVTVYLLTSQCRILPFTYNIESVMVYAVIQVELCLLESSFAVHNMPTFKKKRYSN